MTIILTPGQQAWIDAHVAAGDYASTEEAASRLLDDAISLHNGEDDLFWAKPLVDEALAELDRGEFVTLEEHRKQNKALLAKLARG